MDPRYIAAGCLRIPEDRSDSPKGWRFFPQERRNNPIPDESSLPEALLPFAGLLYAGWIQLSYSGSGIVRVYIFPHDVDYRVIGRNKDHKLTKALSSLLKQLDYSPTTWSSGSTTSPRRSHLEAGADGHQDDDCDCSLLDRFNMLPSPDPRVDAVTPNSLNALAMQGILDSKLPGLHATLYGHQRRSAALMLQREVEPGRVMDPRLRRAIDQHRQPWYFDADAGLVLMEPRYYDQASGGILAEEMGTGKTLICLSLIIATKNLPSEAPDPLHVDIPTRPKVASLLDMAAAAVNRHSFPWRSYLAPQHSASDAGEYYEGCVKALEASENRAAYELKNPMVETRSCNRVAVLPPPAKKIQLSSATLIIVPNNLVTQWQQEIKKHTSGLKVITIEDAKHPVPPVTILLSFDIILFSQSRFERIERESSNGEGRSIIPHCPLEFIRFKRCIIDEGHKLGTRGSQWKSDLIRGLDKLEIAARWVVTGTPSRGLYGVEPQARFAPKRLKKDYEDGDWQAVNLQEREDLQRIGNITSKFLKMRPWSNTRDEVGDTPADWNVYILQPRHHNKSGGRKDCLKATLESLIIRNQLSDVSQYLPSVDEKIVFLDGSYQDKLSLNLFSMMIIFNSVQSQRTDQDYFFHARQRKALLQLVSNLKQASFFGGVFYSIQDIATSLETAETFLEKKEVSISPDDLDLLKSAIAFGKVAVQNRLKDVSNQYHAMPLYVEHFPGGNGKHWSLDDKDIENEPICTDAGLVLALQKFLNPCIDAPTSLELMIKSGQLAQHGNLARTQALNDAMESGGGHTPLAGNTSMGVDYHNIRKASISAEAEASPTTMIGDMSAAPVEIAIAKALAKTQITSTVSAKLSYLIDSILEYQDDEQIIVFYENDNVAYYLAQVFETLQIQHLIYTRKGLNARRRAQYINTFTHNPKFRVLLMDISHAAFGLDMRSASRIYFTSPVLNPQVEAQAVGRARRISQQKPVTVETLVLRGSIEELIVERRESMTQAEHRKVKTILDDKPMYDWILNAKIKPLPEVEDDVAQTAMLKVPQFVFGRGLGRGLDPDEDLITPSGSLLPAVSNLLPGPAPRPIGRRSFTVAAEI
ncbi:P-loop containing nucleoside triphosphate hydrolase protein [Xylariales sp. AK1849]|nr:P-loop containing nucleoside triphosphate hydrolase protein [Xylariales sp. AK1849]